MALKVLDRFSGSNVRVLEIRTKTADPEIFFTADPCGGTEALWFDFRLHDLTPPATGAPETLKLTLMFFETLLGGNNPASIRPVLRERGKAWNRLKAPEVKRDAEGQSQLTWVVPYPVEPMEFAFCIPYGSEELATTLEHCKGYWQERDIGLTQGGKVMKRHSNNIWKGCDACPNPRGLYIVARQHAGETPGSWVLDGMLEAFSRAKPVNWCIWVVPFANLDDVLSGAYGKDPYPHDLNRAWGKPPMRHETLVMQRDLQRWATRCKPELVLDLHAPSASEDQGVYAFVGDSGKPEIDKANQSWSNLFKEALTPDYADNDFVKVANYLSRWDGPKLADFVHKEIGCSALSLETPYGLIRDTVLFQKHYREIGQKLARAILTRWGRG